uniref:PUL domain-containing protein n=1 Tax=Moniliophthora roreri TaxID=221103 RepID=A0A0W0GAT6_MONRR
MLPHEYINKAKQPAAFQVAGNELVMVSKTLFFFSNYTTPMEKLHRLTDLDNVVKVLLDEVAMFENPEHGHPTLLDQALVLITTVANNLYVDDCLPTEDRAAIKILLSSLLTLCTKIEMQLMALG